MEMGAPPVGGRAASVGFRWLATLVLLLCSLTGFVSGTALASTSGKMAAPRIIGGSPAPAGSFPWLAYVYNNLGNGDAAFCSGTVVAVNLVLTAGHCGGNETTGTPYAPSNFTVVTGRLDISDTSAGQASSVRRVIVYPGWDPSTKDGDAALLQLGTVTSAPAMPLASDPGDLSLLDPGTPAVIAGWGRTDPYSESTPSQLQWAQTVVQAPAYCSQQTSNAGGSFDSSDQVCAIDAPSDNTSICNGDSGGPLLAQRSDGTWIEIGITSSSVVPAGTDECQTEDPDFFTRADAVSSWVADWAAALAPPTAITGAATNIAQTSAQLNGRMNPNGSTSTDYFEYGTTTSYGSMASAGTTNNGDTFIGMSAAADHLKPSTTYHFRLVATTANGTTYGDDETLATASLPQLPTMTKTDAKSFVHRTLTGAFRHRFKARTEFVDNCSRDSYARFTCRTTWSEGGNDFYGSVSVWYEIQKGQVVWTDHYAERWVNNQCYLYSGHRHRCKVHSSSGTY